MVASRRSILFLTYSEHGQANVHLATAWELLKRDDYDLHLASYAVLKPRIEELNKEFALQNAQGANVKTPEVAFHEFRGIPMMDYAKLNNIPFPHSPSYNNVVSTFSTCAHLMVREDPEEYIKGFDDMIQLVKDLDPVVIVVDRNCYMAMDACLASGVEYVQMSPCSFYEACAEMQPHGKALWKYPAYVLLAS